jgi:chemotaxis methyl-accepting protein methylase
MSRLALTPIRYRHVVFPDAPDAGGAPLDFTPRINPPRQLLAEERFSSSEFECIARLFGRFNLDVNDYGLETLHRRMPACLRALRVESIHDVEALAGPKPELARRALSTLLLGVTSFFRDPAVFEFLEAVVLPELLAGRASPRIWSVGCSDGAELYSLAILLAQRDALARCTLLGTDCRPDAIALARNGRYESNAIKGLPGMLLKRYFSAAQDVYYVQRSLRESIQWRQSNALGAPEPGLWDLILCRNLAIYLRPAAAGALWARLEGCLRPGGILVLGKAEKPMGVEGMQAVAPCVYRRRSE